MTKYITVLWLAAVIAYFPWQISAETKDKECLSYGPAIVEITGTLKERTHCCDRWIFDKKGPHIYWVVEPDKPVCVKEFPGDPIDVEEYNVEALQLVPISNHMQNMYERYKHFVLKKVVVTGLLLHSTTSHHHTRVMIDVKSIKPDIHDK